MNQTENYQLNQWDKNDRIQMEDFNADNVKIDAALQAISDAGLKIITGSFSGTGTTGTRSYSIGAKPKLLFVRTTNTNSSATYQIGLLVTENLCIAFDSNSGALMQKSGSPGALTDAGFTITHDNAVIGLNTSGSTLYYWALC